MLHRLISSTGSRRLIIVFAGWGMDDRPLGSLAREGYDIALVWDYRSPAIDWSWADGYAEIGIAAWSMGVAAAALTTGPLAGRITRRVAVGGTLTPVSDTCGIPRAIFDGTLAGLDERRLAKFYRRMFATREAHSAFAAVAPRRDIPGLRDELRAIDAATAGGAAATGAPGARYDRAYIGSADAIFPPEAQARAWRRAGVETVVLEGCGHAVDLADILRREFVDKSTMSARFAGAAPTYESAGTVQAAIVGELLADAAPYLPGDDADVLEVGSGSGMLSRRLRAAMPRARLTMWDIAADAPAGVDAPARFQRCDAELAAAELPAACLDAILSASTIQWFNSPARFLGHCARALRPGGLLAVSTFAAGNLAEISAITGRGLNLPDPDGWAAMLPRGLELLRCTAGTRTITFDSPAAALRHLSATGVNSLGGSARRVLRHLPADPSGRYPLTYRPVIIIARRPDRPSPQ